MISDVMVLLASENPVDHVVNSAPQWGIGKLFGMDNVWLWNAHVGTLLLAGIITVVLLWWAATKIRTGPEAEGSGRFVTSNPLAHAIEVILTYLRDDTARPLLGDRTDKFMPFLWTVFFFILINNLLGLVPVADTTHLIDHVTGGHLLSGLVGATATQNIFVTAALALIAALVINFAGIRELGVGGYLKHLTAGTPAPLWILMVPIEIMGTAVKPVALALRLFANMTAGHILVAVLFMFAVQGLGMIAEATVGKLVLGGVVSGVSLVAAVAIYFLELFVAFLQAFVFMFLTTVFISQLSHHDEHEHHGEHDHEHAHA
ncbi:MAG TPA: F0F1 ATP synthase subunit A [Phycisphaerales bacterium]|jgi:F-type H+-transporting ATPase subunit a|nr:F0F1 ATP synthase subunit A [Phycisphaerales bacterium]